MTEFIEVAEKAARAGGEVLLKWLGKISVRSKRPKDLVTEADLESQQVIADILTSAFPDHDFLGEESEPAEVHVHGNSAFRWIVDPLDGTTNFVHQLPNFSVSIALQHESQIRAGLIYDPILDECFAAERGYGATLNGTPISTSDCENLSAALIAASFSAAVPRGSVEVARFVEVLHECRAIRRLGSAALNLSYVACGRLDGYWATSVKLWDVAAGLLLVEEAGGITTNLRNGPINLEQPALVASSGSPLHAELLDHLARAEQS